MGSVFDFVRFLATGTTGFTSAGLGSAEAEVRGAAAAAGLAVTRAELDPGAGAFGIFAGGVEFLFDDDQLTCVQFEVDRTGPLDLAGTRVGEDTTLEEFTRALDRVGIGWSVGVSSGGEPVVETTGSVRCHFTAEAPHRYVTAIATVGTPAVG